MPYETKDKTWSDDVCGAKIEMIMPISGGLNECQKRCNMKKECTAIEYSNDAIYIGVKCCILRKCPLPVPSPQVVQAQWHGGQYKYVGYVKGK